MLAPPVITSLPLSADTAVPTKDEDQVSTKSRSSSFSQSSQSSQGSLNYRKFHHHREPTVLDRPFVLESMKNALLNKDTDMLARLTREYGLPPSLRSSAWPLLLETHPYVQQALADADNIPLLSDDKLPIKRIHGDIKRLRRYRGPALLEDAIYNAIHTFLRQWGSRIPYDTAMVWIADFLASGDGNDVGLNSSPTSTTNNSSSTTSSPLSNSPTSSGSWPAALENAPADDSNFAFAGIDICLMPRVFTYVMLVIDHSPAEFSDFVATVRQTLPELSQHFAYEGVLFGSGGGDDWLIWWLRWLGIRAFPPSMLGRLWDDYFSLRNGSATVPLMRQHLYNCILLMKENRGRLLELDQSECRQYLAHVPPSRDVEALIKEARGLVLSTFVDS